MAMRLHEPLRRSGQIGYVPQDSSLFPTMKVHRQIAFGMEVRGFSQADRSQRVEELASSLDITEILDRYPRGLSGGEKTESGTCSCLIVSAPVAVSR